MYLNLHEERKKLVEPVELPWEQQLEQWNAKEYKQKEFQEGTAVILTEKGERVRSKSEKILADYFYRNGIPYKYEKPLYLKGLGIVHPEISDMYHKYGIGYVAQCVADYLEKFKDQLRPDVDLYLAAKTYVGSLFAFAVQYKVIIGVNQKYTDKEIVDLSTDIFVRGIIK